MTGELVYPVLVDGTPIAHLATAVLDGTGAGYRPICPAGQLVSRPLRLIKVGERFVWCGACRGWAESAGVELPTPGGPLEEASTDSPADG